MASLPNPKRVTYEEWLQMPEVQDAIEEVVDGEIFLMPLTIARHALVIQHISDQLGRGLDRARYTVLTCSAGLVISKVSLTCRVPDIAVVDPGLPADVYYRSAHLLVEVISPTETRRMIERKLADYESIATPEVWIVSPRSRAVEVFLLESGGLERAAVLTGGMLSPRAFPGVRIDIDRIWPE